MRLLFEGGDYNIQGLAGGGYYSRAATIRGRRLIEEIRYASEVKLSSLYRQGWPENTNGFEIDFLNDIHAFNFKPIAIFQGGGL